MKIVPMGDLPSSETASRFEGRDPSDHFIQEWLDQDR
jgi:hypothetical protein